MQRVFLLPALLAGICLSAPNVAAQGWVWLEQQKLAAGDAGALDEFGRSVALDADTALVGSQKDDNAAGVDAGSAYVFTRSGTTWVETSKLTAGDAAADDQFGIRVALSPDTAAIGSYFSDTAGGTNAGAVYVFARSGIGWSQQAKLSAGDGSDHDVFGHGVAISGDRIAVGARCDPHSVFPVMGTAYVFARNGTSWSQEAQLSASNAAVLDLFGYSVSISGDTLVVGARDGSGAAASSGAAYVFARSGTAWPQQAHLTASDGAPGDNFGISVCVDGTTALVGAPDDDDAGAASGAAYVFVRSGSTWSEEAKLTAADGGTLHLFGTSVSLAGNTALVGAFRADGLAASAGAVYGFVRSGTTWTQEAKLTAGDGISMDALGVSVAASGGTALVGAHGRDDAGTLSGAAYAFLVGKGPEGYCSGKTNSLGCVPYLTTTGVPSTTGTGSFKIKGNDLLPNVVAFGIYGEKRSGLAFHGGTLCVKSPFRRWYPAKMTKSNGSGPCVGTLTKDFNAQIQGGADPTLTVGRKVSLQLWFRDSADPAGFGDGLTDGVRFTVL